MDKSLEGKVCVIVGACGLIGSEFARGCARSGAITVISDLDTKKGEILVEEIKSAGGKTEFIACNAMEPESVKELAQTIMQKYGKVDGLVNTAYPRPKTWRAESYENLKYENFLKHLEMQVGPSFLTAREFGEIMAKQGSGSIVLMGSLYATHAPRFEMYEGTDIMPTPVEYTIAKGGLVMLNKYLAKYYGPKGVRVNMLSPGGIIDKEFSGLDESFGKYVPLGGHMQQSADLPGTLIYYFSDASRQVTGQNITIDGGWTL